MIIPNNKVEFKGDKNIARTQETNLGNLITDAMEITQRKTLNISQISQ